jgi:hypothetical protein
MVMAVPFHDSCYLELRGPLQLFIGIGKNPAAASLCTTPNRPGLLFLSSPQRARGHPHETPP